MNVSLTEALERYIREQVDGGLYGDASEVVREALREKMRKDARETAEIEDLRATIDVGWQQAERGQFANLDLADLNRDLDAEVDA